MTACRSCGQEVRWERTHAGKPIPLDPEPRDDGNLAIREDGRVVNASGFPEGAPRYVTHFTTCPDADKWRRG